jgi:hypothetical protein
MRARASSLFRDHPVPVAWTVVVVIGFFAFRGLWGPEPLSGGALQTVPQAAPGFFQELASSVRTTAMGGAQTASPSLGGMGVLSWLTFGSPRVAQELLLVLLPILAGVTCFRALSRRTGRKGAAVVGGACYATSAVALWALSQGRIDVLVMLAVLPPFHERVRVGFGPRPHSPVWRFAVGIGVVLAVGVAFYPGMALVAAMLLVAFVVVPVQGGHMLRGIVLFLVGALTAAVLLLPIVLEGAGGTGMSVGTGTGRPDIALLARFAPGSGPGSWVVAWFLPAAALLAFAVVDKTHGRAAFRSLLLAVAGVGLAWASAAGYLPEDLSNVPAYLAVGAFSAACIVGLGLASAVGTVTGQSFGHRHVVVATLSGLLLGGLLLTSVQTARGDWAFGADRLPPAWPIVTDPEQGFTGRVLVLGRDDGEPLNAPAGDPDGVVVTPAGTVAFALIEPEGRSMIDLARGNGGPGYQALREAIATAVSGGTVHGGSVLAPFAVGSVVAEEGTLPDGILEALTAQSDLDRVPAGGLVIFRNAAALPRASVLAVAGFADAAASDDPLALAVVDPSGEVAELPREGTSYGTVPGASSERYLYLADQDPLGWRLVASGDPQPPEGAFGWAAGWPVPPGDDPMTLRYEADGRLKLELAVLAVAWAVALWVTRKPLRRVEPRTGERAEPVA